jgi:uncharacterized protein (DUF305 family)
MKTISLTMGALMALVSSAALSQDGSIAESVTLPDICVTEMGRTAAEAMPPMPAQHEMDAAHAALMTGMDQMQTSMMTGMMAADVDVAFNCGMLPHHQGAINMARAELAHGDDEESKARAQKIIDAQQKEIEEILAWLEKQPK